MGKGEVGGIEPWLLGDRRPFTEVGRRRLRSADVCALV